MDEADKNLLYKTLKEFIKILPSDKIAEEILDQFGEYPINIKQQIIEILEIEGYYLSYEALDKYYLS